MQPNSFTITGHIIDRQTKQGISGLRIEARARDFVLTTWSETLKPMQIGSLRSVSRKNISRN